MSKESDNRKYNQNEDDENRRYEERRSHPKQAPIAGPSSYPNTPAAADPDFTSDPDFVDTNALITQAKESMKNLSSDVTFDNDKVNQLFDQNPVNPRPELSKHQSYNPKDFGAIAPSEPGQNVPSGFTDDDLGAVNPANIDDLNPVQPNYKADANHRAALFPNQPIGPKDFEASTPAPAEPGQDISSEVPSNKDIVQASGVREVTDDKPINPNLSMPFPDPAQFTAEPTADADSNLHRSPLLNTDSINTFKDSPAYQKPSNNTPRNDAEVNDLYKDLGNPASNNELGDALGKLTDGLNAPDKPKPSAPKPSNRPDGPSL